MALPKKPRIEFPNSPVAKLAMINSVANAVDVHAHKVAASPLEALWTLLDDERGMTQQMQDEFTAADTLAKEKRAARDISFEVCDDLMRQIRDIGWTNFQQTPVEIQQYGFTPLVTVKSTKPPEVIVLEDPEPEDPPA